MNQRLSVLLSGINLLGRFQAQQITKSSGKDYLPDKLADTFPDLQSKIAINK